MANGTITLTRTGSGLLDGRIVWSSKSNGTEANTSTVTAELQIRRNSQSSTTSGTFSGTFTVGETSVGVSSFLSLGYTWVTLETLTITVNHDKTGAGSCYLYAKVSGPSGTSMSGTYVEGKKTVAMDIIAKPSVIDSAKDVFLGSVCSVTWTPNSAILRYKLKFVFDTFEHTTAVIHPNKTTAYTYAGYTVPMDIAYALPYTPTGEMSVTLYTYSDSGTTDLVGEDTKIFKITVPDNQQTKPSVSMTLSPVGDLPEKFSGLYIQGKTKVKATITATGKYNSQIDWRSITVDGKKYGLEDDYTSEFLSNYGSINVIGKAIDSREYEGSTEATISVIAYSAPTVNVTSCSRCDSSGQICDDGAYLKIRATRSYQDVKSGGVQKNFCKVQYRYMAAAANSWSDWATILEADNLSSNTVETDALLEGMLSPKVSYLVEIQAIDDLGGHTETVITIPTEEVYWHRTKNALGLGKYAEGENLLDVGWDAHFRGEVRIGDAGITLKDYILSVINEGG